GGTATFNNQGTLTKSSGGSASISAALNNSGTVDVESGTLNLAGAVSNYPANALTGGAPLVGGPPQAHPSTLDISTNAATIVLDGTEARITNSAGDDALANFSTNASGGSFTIQNGRNFTAPSGFTNSGNLAIGADSTFTAPNLANNAGGILSGAGTVAANVISAARVHPATPSTPAPL